MKTVNMLLMAICLAGVTVGCAPPEEPATPPTSDQATPGPADHAEEAPSEAGSTVAE